MLFKPNFCCNCGQKIERAEWGILSSRRFCEVCSVENRKHDWFPRAIVLVGVLAGIFGVGVWLGGPPSSPAVPLATSRDERLPKLKVSETNRSGIKAVEPATESNSVPTTAAELSPQFAGPEKATAENRSPGEPVYYCGAMTKKGTPCSRRVKVKGARCWQHVGKPPALLSQSVPDVY